MANCPICCNSIIEFGNMTGCENHSQVYCFECLKKWVKPEKKSHSCPSCRRLITSITPQNTITHEKYLNREVPVSILEEDPSDLDSLRSNYIRQSSLLNDGNYDRAFEEAYQFSDDEDDGFVDINVDNAVRVRRKIRPRRFLASMGRRIRRSLISDFNST